MPCEKLLMGAPYRLHSPSYAMSSAEPGGLAGVIYKSLPVVSAGTDQRGPSRVQGENIMKRSFAIVVERDPESS